MTITEYFDKYTLKYVTNYDTSKLSSIKSGGIANYVIYPENKEELAMAIRLCLAFSLKYKVIGGCTNTLFKDGGFNGAIISTKALNRIYVSENRVFCESGTSLTRVLKTASRANLSLYNGLFGIPGTLGGAVRNNAGAFGGSVSDCFEFGSFYCVTADRFLSLDKSDLSFSYRNSLLQKEDIVFLGGFLKGKPQTKSEIEYDFAEAILKRKENQPNEPSLGSVFKRSPNVIPAKLIDCAGLKGKRVGEAEISNKHAGFIINRKNATSSDIDLLAKEIEKTILEKYGVSLIREIEIVD